MDPKFLPEFRVLSSDAFRAAHERFVARKHTKTCERCQKHPAVDGYECRECRAEFSAWMWEAA